jgi:DNA polymerase III delta subunit
MDARYAVGLVLFGGIVLLFTTGCPRVEPPENALTWGLKAASGQLTQATAREWQAIVERVDERIPEANISITEEQADVIVDFVRANDLDSFQEIADLVQQAQDDPSVIEELEIPESMIEMFEELGDNPEDIMDDILGGLGA